MQSRSISGLAVVLILSGSNAASQTGPKTVDTAKISVEVMAAAHARIDALNAHDAEKNVSADLPDVVIMSHGAANDVGAAADLATTKTMVADPLAHVDLNAESVDVGGSDFAVYHSAYVLTSTDPKTKTPVHEHGNLLIGFKRQPDGVLKVAWEIASDVAVPK
jgi:ketosteroid isomerase-like protein